MSDLITAAVNWNVIEGAGLALGAVTRVFRGSGLSVSFQTGRVGAIGLDFIDERHHHDPQHAVNWSFVLKVANPNAYTIAIENISAVWRGGRTFYAETVMATINMMHPKPFLPDGGDESLPMLIKPGGIGLFKVDCLLLLYKKRILRKSLTPYTRETYGTDHPKNLRYVVKLKTNRGQTALKA